MKLTHIAACIASCLAFGAHAQVSDNVVKIGVLNDLSGVYSDLSGQGSVIAARLAIEEFGGKVLGAPIELIFADHQNKPEIGRASCRERVSRSV